MADTKISNLTSVVTPAGTDEFPVNQGGTTKKETLSQVKTYLDTTDLHPQSVSTGSSPSTTGRINLSQGSTEGVWARNASNSGDIGLLAANSSDEAELRSTTRFAANAFNHLRASGAATGNDPKLEAIGSDTNVSLNLTTQGSGTLKYNGTEVSKVDHTHSAQAIFDSIDGLSNAAALADANRFVVTQSATAKDAALSDLVTYLQTKGMPRTRKLTGAHTLSSATATKMTDLDMTLEAGTYQFRYFLIMKSSATGTGLAFGLNFSGTAANRAFELRYPSTGTTANTGVADDVGALGGQIHESNSQTAFSTTTGNLTFTGVATANAAILGVVEGTIEVTVSGDLQLYHGSEGAVSTTVEQGSSLVVVRVS